VSVPTYDQVIEHLLRCLTQHQEPAPTWDVYAALADRLGLSESERQPLLSSTQQAVYQNRIGLTHDRLKQAGLSAGPSRSMWQLTEQGRRIVAQHPRALTPQQADQLAHAGRDTRLRPIEATTQPRPTAEEVARRQSPDERIDTALAELREQTAPSVSICYSSKTPAFLSRSSSPTCSHSSVLWLDDGATNGVFITTSAFSREAWEFGESVRQDRFGRRRSSRRVHDGSRRGRAAHSDSDAARGPRLLRRELGVALGNAGRQ
jgi:restriction endonuclease Mrr